MMNVVLNPPVSISGRIFSDFDEAAHAIRQNAIATGDHGAWHPLIGCGARHLPRTFESPKWNCGRGYREHRT